MIQKNQGNLADKPQIIGFDCHPDIFTAAAVTGNNPIDARVSWINDRVPLSKLEKWVSKKVSHKDIIVIEASENTFSVVKRIQALGRTVVIVESYQASKVKKDYCSTDKTSAVSLAKVYLSGFANFVWMPDDKTLCRREVFHAHKRAVKDTTQARNRISSFLNQHSLRHFCKKDFNSSLFKDELLSEQEWTDYQMQIIEMLFDDLWHNQNKRQALRKTMAQDILDDAESLQLVRIFGIRHIVAYSLMAIIGDINRFPNPKKLVAYMGLNPRVNQSGIKDKSSGRSRQGRKDIRSLLVESAQTVLKNSDSPLYKWGWKLAYRKGKNTAIIAIARKIVVSCWYLLKGHFVELTEVPDNIKLKIDKLAREIGSETVKSWGYNSLRAYKDEKYNLLLNYG